MIRTYEIPHTFFGPPVCLICRYNGDMCICTAEEISAFMVEVDRTNGLKNPKPGPVDALLDDLAVVAGEDLCHCGAPKGECQDEGGRPAV